MVSFLSSSLRLNYTGQGRVPKPTLDPRRPASISAARRQLPTNAWGPARTAPSSPVAGGLEAADAAVARARLAAAQVEVRRDALVNELDEARAASKVKQTQLEAEAAGLREATDAAVGSSARK